MQQNQYDKEPLTAVEAQRLAQEIAFGPIDVYKRQCQDKPIPDDGYADVKSNALVIQYLPDVHAAVEELDVYKRQVSLSLFRVLFRIISVFF